MKAWLKLLRLHHCVKNVLVFAPLFFHGRFFETHLLLSALAGWFAFTCWASAVYVLNDCLDARRDRLHPVKRFRPIASGAVSRRSACCLLVGLLLAGGAALWPVAAPGRALAWGALYVGLNMAYSFGWKHIPVLDVAILACGFLIRVMFGSAITGIAVSHWLYLTVLTGACYLGLGKRRNELRRLKGARTRRVLRFYTAEFLDRNMYLCLGLAIAFYALWSVAQGREQLVWTVPLVLLILMKYNLTIERESDGDPVEVFLHDPALIILGLAYAGLLLFLLYAPWGAV